MYALYLYGIPYTRSIYNWYTKIALIIVKVHVHTHVASGAVGASLTGAGLGGCVVGIVPECMTVDVMDALEKSYYEPRGIVGDKLREAVFSVKPIQGASLLEL
jgi:galactokinase